MIRLSNLPPAIQWVVENPLLAFLLVVFIIGLFYLEFNSSYKPELQNSDKVKAMRPPVNKKLLCKKPHNAVIFGKCKGRYVAKPLDIDGHILCLGGSGSGKSSCLAIPTLLSVNHLGVFAIDIKGELSKKSVLLDSENTIVFNPLDESTYGFDPFWKLDSKACSEQILFETMQTIVFSLIPLPANISNGFWKMSARNLLIGLFLYQYKSGRDNLIDIIDEILSQPTKNLLTTIEDDLEPDSIENRLLSSFIGLADETLGGIVAEATQALSIFATDSHIRHCFKDNFQKMNPSMLEEGKQIYLAIPEDKISSYATVLHLVINLTLQELEKRPEDSKRILFLIDELPRVLSSGKLERLLDGARTLRSRNVTLLLITQSIEALSIAYSSAEVQDLISNCPYMLILSATSSKTISNIEQWCGKYLAPKISINGIGNSAKTSISYQEENIINASDLMTLAQSGDAILISPYGYNRVKKCPYYKDNHFNRLHKIIRNHNDEYINRINSSQHLVNQKTYTDTSSKSNIQNTLLEWDDSLISLPNIDTTNLKFNESED